LNCQFSNTFDLTGIFNLYGEFKFGSCAILAEPQKFSEVEEFCLGMIHRVALVRTDVSEELSASEKSVLTIATRRNIQEDTILHSNGSENLKFYLAMFFETSYRE
jgi:hypothetical protein